LQKKNAHSNTPSFHPPKTLLEEKTQFQHVPFTKEKFFIFKIPTAVLGDNWGDILRARVCCIVQTPILNKSPTKLKSPKYHPPGPLRPSSSPKWAKRADDGWGSLEGGSILPRKKVPKVFLVNFSLGPRGQKSDWALGLGPFEGGF